MKTAYVISILSVALLMLTACGSDGPHTLNAKEKSLADLSGREFASRLGNEFVGCSGQDSEPDGYVTCTLLDKASNETKKMQCSYQGDGGGCKL